MSGSLYVVSTPIGNLDDLSRRALEVLGQVDWVAAEDTRHSQTLLNHLGIKARLISCHDHNEAERSPELVARLCDGESGALISDAGTPLVSDPGYRLVRACQDAGVAVVPVPGASALLAALAVSGQPSDRFLFEGFVPSKGAARENALRRLAGLEVTSVIFEAPHRVVSLLESLAGRRRPGADPLPGTHQTLRDRASRPGGRAAGLGARRQGSAPRRTGAGALTRAPRRTAQRTRPRPRQGPAGGTARLPRRSRPCRPHRAEAPRPLQLLRGN
jgi:siroheme synthase